MRHLASTRTLAALALALAVVMPAAAAGLAPAGTIDNDGDGWSEADGDCCDTTATCANPASVNPGAYDFPGNGIDDDCSGGVDDAPTNCSTPDFSAVSALQIAQAIDVCQSTVVNPPLSNRRWGLLSARYLLANGAQPTSGQLSNMVNLQTAVTSLFGTVVAPRFGSTLAVLSTGAARDESDAGFAVPEPGTSLGTSVTPTLLLGAPGCPNTGSAFDSIVVELDVRVPTNAGGIAIDERFYSSEFPDRCAVSNDQAQIVITSLAPGIPADGNIAFDQSGNALTAQQATWPWCVATAQEPCASGTGELAGTGYELVSNGTTIGAATSWATARAPVVPGETITLRFTVFEGLDGMNDSLLLLDNLRWVADRMFADGFE